jgi:hypothetical protein
MSNRTLVTSLCNPDTGNEKDRQGITTVDQGSQILKIIFSLSQDRLPGPSEVHEMVTPSLLALSIPKCFNVVPLTIVVRFILPQSVGWYLRHFTL